jgi:hypothetical protein
MTSKYVVPLNWKVTKFAIHAYRFLLSKRHNFGAVFTIITVLLYTNQNVRRTRT